VLAFASWYWLSHHDVPVAILAILWVFVIVCAVGAGWYVVRLVRRCLLWRRLAATWRWIRWCGKDGER
jgi:hypothetical protein